jgi:hypothetical protein
MLHEQALGYYIATDSDANTKRRITVVWVQRGEDLWQGMAGVAPAFPIRLFAWVMPRVCPDGRVGRQADQPGSTHTLSPSVHVGRR